MNNNIIKYVDVNRVDKDKELMSMIVSYNDDKLYHDKTLEALKTILDSEVNKYLEHLYQYNVLVSKLNEKVKVLYLSKDFIEKVELKCLDLEISFISIRYIEW